MSRFSREFVTKNNNDEDIKVSHFVLNKSALNNQYQMVIKENNSSEKIIVDFSICKSVDNNGMDFNFSDFFIKEICSEPKFIKDKIFDLNSYNESDKKKLKTISDSYFQKGGTGGYLIIPPDANDKVKVFLSKFEESIYSHLQMLENATLMYIFSQTTQIDKKGIGYGGLFILFSKEITDYDSLKNLFQLYSDVISTRIAHNVIREKIRQESIKSAIAAIMSRNMSHNLGSHVISGTKNYLVTSNFEGIGNGAAKGIYRLYQYLQERMDFISVIINSAHNGYSFYAPLNMKADILDEIAADGREKRHGVSNGGEVTKSFLLDNIVKSEGVCRQYGAELGDEQEIPIEIMLLKKEMENGEEIIKSFTSESNGDNNANDFNDINFSIPFGINSRHAFLTIIENYIRNSAKHNREYPVKTLLISIMVEETEELPGFYKITVFDNKNMPDDKLQELKNILCENITILNGSNSLDTRYKGFKEMLLCCAWLKNMYQDWSIIERNKGEEKLLDFISVKLDAIKQPILKHIKQEKEKISSAEDIEDYQTKLNDREKKIENYTDVTAFGVEFHLPKHQFIYCREITDSKEVYDFPSADFYAVKANESLHKEIENILCKVFFVDDIESIKNKNDAEQKEFIIEQYKAKYLKKERETSIVAYYNTHPTGDITEKNVRRLKHNGKETNISLLPEVTDRNICLFSRHNDIPNIFESNYSEFATKYGNRLKFLEGISGGSYNYNLLINALLDELNELKIIDACYSKIAIIDERIYKKYGSWKVKDKPFNLADAKKFNDELISYRKGEKDELSDDCLNAISDYIHANKMIDVENWINSNNLITPPKIISDLLRLKNIYIYNCIINDQQQEVRLIDLHGNEINELPHKMDFVSTHYGIIQKLPSTDNAEDIKSKYKAFLTKISGESMSKSKAAIHSGRGGVAEQQTEITFIPLSTIEAQLEDCKYKLAQLFFNLKYKPL